MDPKERLEALLTGLANNYRLDADQQAAFRRCLEHVLGIEGTFPPDSLALIERLAQLEAELRAFSQQADYLRRRLDKLMEKTEADRIEYCLAIQRLLKKYPGVPGDIAANQQEASSDPFSELEELESLMCATSHAADLQDSTGRPVSEFLATVTEYGQMGQPDDQLTIILCASSEYRFAEDQTKVIPKELRQAVAYRLDLSGRRVRVFRSPSFSVRQNEHGINYVICTESLYALPYGNLASFWAHPISQAQFEATISVPLDEPALIYLRLLDLLETLDFNAESSAYKNLRGTQVRELTGAMAALEYCPHIL